jgi:N-sulfoglucosamine sulfohydrolase
MDKRFKHIILLLILMISVNQVKSEQLNIIWLMAEDMSLDLECYGMKGLQTPNLNKLAEQGVMYTNCFVTNPICSPSRSAMMTGTHQLKINAHNHRSNRNIPLHQDYKPFTYWLRDAGYTCILGHHGVFDKGMKIDVNFKSKAFGEWDGIKNFGLFDKKLEFNAEDQPFFAQIQLKITHRGDWWSEIREKSTDPVNPDSIELPPYYADHPVIRLDWAKYLDQVEYMDSEVGMIIQELKDKGLDKNTIIIFIGDNGRCNIRGKGYLHDPGLRIPFIVFYPDGRMKSKVVEDVVAATDITATILDLAGIEIPDYMTGQSLLKQKNERSEVFSTRDYWDEIPEQIRSISTNKWKYIRNDKPEQPFDAHQAYLEFYRPAVHVMRSLKKQGKLNKQQAFFFESNKPVEELYDLEADPFETNNLANSKKHEEVLQQMQNKLKTYEKNMAPVSDHIEVIPVISVDVYNWIKEDRPELYQQMIDGEEIGYQGLVDEYKKLKIK